MSVGFSGHWLTFGCSSGMNTTVQSPLPANATECPICKSQVLKSGLRKHQLSLKCETAKLIHTLRLRGLVDVDYCTAKLLVESGVKMEKHATAYYHFGRRTRAFYQYWVPKAVQIIGYHVRLCCSAINRNRKRVVQDLLANDLARVSIELGVEPGPFVEESANRLGIKYNLSRQGPSGGHGR